LTSGLGRPAGFIDLALFSFHAEIPRNAARVQETRLTRTAEDKLP
jgi:hypothetical protein